MSMLGRLAILENLVQGKFGSANVVLVLLNIHIQIVFRR